MNKRVWFISIITSLLIACCLKPPWPYLIRFLTVDQELEQADVIIALSGGTERELYAAELYRLGYAPRIIMSGIAPGAQSMARRAIEVGVPCSGIVIEDKSESTYDNAVFTREIVLQQNFKSAIVVSSAYHMRRSKMVFERVFKGTGVKLVFCAAKGTGLCPGSYPVNYDNQLIVEEYIKLLYYWFRYW